MARRTAASLLVLVGAVLLTVGLPLHGVHRTTRPDAFADHASRLLERPVVREQLAGSATSAVADAVADVAPRAGDLARRVVAPRAARVVASPGFARAWRTAARTGLRHALDEDRRRVVFAIGGIADLTTAATGPLPVPLDALVRRAGDVPVLSFRRNRTDAVRTARAERAAASGRPLLAAGTLALLLALVVSPARGPTALRCGIAVAGAGATVLLVEVLARAAVLGGTGSDGALVGEVWDELVGDVRTGALLLVGAGLAVVLVAAVAGRRPRPRRATR